VEKREPRPSHTFPGDLPSGLASLARRALAAAGITRLEQFTKFSEAESLKLHGLGPKAIKSIKQSMQENSLSFAKENESIAISEKANQQIEQRVPK
jgi:DNA-directed RNA polymerase alpha subunit